MDLFDDERKKLYFGWGDEYAHPDSPTGGGGPGYFRQAEQLGVGNAVFSKFLHPDSPACKQNAFIMHHQSSGKSQLSEEFRLFVSTVYGEAGNSSETSWKAIAWVMKNRIGKLEWAKFRTIKEIIEKTGFDAYTQRTKQFEKSYMYLANRKTAAPDSTIESIIYALEGIYNGTDSDITYGAVLYYSPKAQVNLHKKKPNMYNEKPSWNFDRIEEVTVKGLLATDDFKFYRYK